MIKMFYSLVFGFSKNILSVTYSRLELKVTILQKVIE
ncbi:unnamed protein product [Commensalibacter papalotli (ex Botero et al. 2024)]|uniref:Uncharacterized protein n=1 Tax=Commensalibacter papalotli (ex Botero et al. 2024) TaxID=2972766 RepID=A0ABM9HMZ4_9PROT|nr:unnamed protein product [Commensalibacter papalotli (ex Botero et al. 2024)]